MDWSKSYSARWAVYSVDRETWSDGAELNGVVSVDIKRSSGDLIESGSMKVDMNPTESFEDGYYRIVMTAVQDGVEERVDVSTMLFRAESGSIDRSNAERDINGCSVLKPADTKKMTAGDYAPKGADGAAWAAEALRGCIHAPVDVSGSFTLESHVVFDIGSTLLEAVWLVLEAGGFTMIVEGDGTVRVCPMPSEPSLVLDQAAASLLMPGIEYDADLSEIPNRYTAIEDDIYIATVENDDPNSPTSWRTTGYVIDEVDTSPTRVDGETLAAYARRKLSEASTLPEKRTYKREWYPGVYPSCVVRGSLASVGLDGDMRVESQSLECGAGIVVQEEASKEVRTWPI